MLSGDQAATRTVVAVFGVLAALAGVEHGVGEVLQGSLAPEGLVIRSWPGHEGFEALDGEPALTVIPNLLVSGAVTVVVAVSLGAWAITGMDRRHGAVVLVGLSLLLLAVGGGVGPPLLGVILGFGAWRVTVPTRPPGSVRRLLIKVWPWALGAGVVGYLGLVPGTLVWHTLWGDPPEAVVYGLMVLAFAGVLLALLGARNDDRHLPGAPVRS